MRADIQRMRFLLGVAVMAVSAFASVPFADAETVYLEPAERERVIALVQSDDRIRVALHGARVRIDDVLPWSGDGTRATLIGGGVTLTFESPQDVEADWPLLEFPDNPNEYAIAFVHYRVKHADAIDAWVDLRKDRVVSFDVLGGEVDESSVRFLGTPAASDRSPTSEGSNGFGIGALVALGIAVLGAAVAAGFVVARRRATHPT